MAVAITVTVFDAEQNGESQEMGIERHFELGKADATN